MDHESIDRRRWLAGALACAVAPGALAADPDRAPRAARLGKPFRIYAITFRGMTDVEKGFEEYFASRKIPVQIAYRDLNRDASRMPALLEEIRATRPDLIYTWGTSVTLGVVGPFDNIDLKKHISDIPVVFTLVAAVITWRLAAGGLTAWDRAKKSMFLQLPEWWGYALGVAAAVLWVVVCAWTAYDRLQRARRA